ncbi:MULTISPECIES: porin [Porphyromonadaceae]|uniref:Histidine kinase n=1 Tax=Sanguibacteroides justesenii TaxID=1547597 RepID=A0A0C3NES0_9PORP|nr:MULTISPECIES: porin [Porphyromonadaceae]KIO44627.1 histidine kinase [Sanguibacteroides justesenii]KIO46356.1 histidine kinase [Sanguibacteroides justesenii]MCR9011482.1 porin [Gabonibacter chumensis]
MKKYILFPLVLVAAMLSSNVIKAQDQDVEPLLKYINKENGLKLTAGGRLFADFAYYHTEFTPMKSGAAITDARIRTSLTWKNFYFYADFDFSKGTFKQKNIFVRYNFKESVNGIHSVKAGYFNEPSTMSLNTSLYNYHFISRPAGVNALSPGRALGVTYKYFDRNFFADQGFFAENKYNDQIAGFQGFSLSGRWLYKPINNDYMTLQFGIGMRYGRINSGEVINDNVFKTNLEIEANMQTYVDATTRFLNADVAWAKNTLNVNPELLFRTDRFFFRGEYIFKKIWKDRDDLTLFENQLGGQQSWQTLVSWQNGNPIRASKFDAAYVELGYLLCGKAYTYDDEYALLGGMNDKGGLEVVARYSYTNLNDINKGDVFLIGNHKFYPNGEIKDYPVVSTSIGGGRMHAVTLGLNYSFNQYVKVMGEYQYANLDNVYFPNDKNFHQLQLRLMVSF